MSAAFTERNIGRRHCRGSCVSPVLLVEGEYDGISALADLQAFFDKLPNGDRQLSIIRGAAHSLIVSRAHRAFHQVTQAFLTMPDLPVSG